MRLLSFHPTLYSVAFAPKQEHASASKHHNSMCWDIAVILVLCDDPSPTGTGEVVVDCFALA